MGVDIKGRGSHPTAELHTVGSSEAEQHTGIEVGLELGGLPIEFMGTGVGGQLAAGEVNRLTGRCR